ncbi:unnamed protein product, partial [Laminaria digitata]
MASTSSTDLPLTSEGGGHSPSSPPSKASGISLALQETSGSPTRGMDRDRRSQTEGGARSVNGSASGSDSISDSLSECVSEYGSPLAEAASAVKTAAETTEWACSSPSKLSTYHTPPQSPPLLPSSPSRLTKSSSTLGGYAGVNDKRVESGIRRHAGHTLFVQHPQQQNHSGEGSEECSGELSEERSGERERFRRRSADCSANCFVDSPECSPTDRSAEHFADRSAERAAERFGKRSGGSRP